MFAFQIDVIKYNISRIISTQRKPLNYLDFFPYICGYPSQTINLNDFAKKAYLDYFQML